MLLRGVHACCLRLQALLENPDAQAADTAGLQLAAALGFAVYGFKEWKRLPLGKLQPEKGGHHILCRTAIITERHVSATGVHVGSHIGSIGPAGCSELVCVLSLLAGRAVGLSVAALVAGILLGAGLEAWLRVDIVPIGVSKTIRLG